MLAGFFFFWDSSLIIVRMALPRPRMKPVGFGGEEMLIVGVGESLRDMVQVLTEFGQRIL